MRSSSLPLNLNATARTERQVHSEPLNGIRKSFSEADDMTGEKEKRFVFRTRATFKSR